ncbi:MAG TPA: hypothetical protein VK386_02205 [Acidimicrobiales bacterium]|nr:hypothetical protein [Acidimicrobiales bacterium]
MTDEGVAHPRLWQWARFDPPLRDPQAGAGARREVSCRVCGAQFGHSEDPVDALLVAWRHRRHMRR